MSEATPRFALPFIIPGQAQKEFFHNEALTSIDLALHPAVQASPLGAAPASPAEGECWIVAPGAGGPWSGKAHQLAMWTASGWRFVPPREGMAAWNKQAGHAIRWDGTNWSTGELTCASLHIGGEQVVAARQPAIANPTGGTVVDAEGRTAIASIIAALMSHGLVD